jgi:ABC-type branched-subunit amino acid transport system substrate-binding protein
MENAQGGINGNKLKLVIRDDEYDPKKTAPLVEDVIEKEKVVALVNSAGTAPTLAVVKSGVLNKYRVPLVGVFSGADVIRGPGSEEIFHTRPTYGDEIHKIARLASTLGLHRVALLYQDDAFGQGILKSVAASEQEFKLQLVVKAAYKPGTKDFRPQAKLIEDAKPQAIFLMGVPDSAYQFMKAYNAPAGSAQIYTLSFVTAKPLADIAGEAHVRGIGISQVVPNPNSATMPLIKDFQTLVRKCCRAWRPCTIIASADSLLISTAQNATVRTSSTSRSLDETRDYSIDDAAHRPMRKASRQQCKNCSKVADQNAGTGIKRRAAAALQQP